MDYYSFLGAVARILPPETAHSLAISALRHGIVPTSSAVIHPALVNECFGLTFANPVGLAAGFDKNAEALNGLLAQGFGFVEAGTVTPLPQTGNPAPRLFRLPENKAIINRLGFNNLGMQTFVANLQRRSKAGIIGANIGKNKDSLDAGHDYSVSFEAVYPHADYITINISSPNTVGLRDLQQKAALSNLMQTIEKKRIEMAVKHHLRRPVLYKIAPDLTESDKEDIVEVALALKVDGLIISNTTISRPEHVQHRRKKEKGGLSGKPLFALSTETLRDIYKLSSGKLTLIGVGGISSPEDAYTKIKAGASLVQLYTALVYQGFGLVKSINHGLIGLLAHDGFKNIKDAIGCEAR